MDARHLRVFLAIVDAGGITRAAKALHVSQPSVSQTLRAMEKECGVQLFHRIGRGLKITPAGEALLGPARQALRSVETVADQVAPIRELRSGRLDIGTHSMLESDPLGDMAGRFRKAYPGISIRILDSEDASGVTSLVRDGSCEVALAFLPLKAPDLVVQPLGWQEWYVIFPPDTVPNSGPITITELARVPLVVPPAGSPTRTLLDKAFADAGVQPHIALEATARERMMAFVLAGVGAALYPSAMATRAGAVVRVPRPRMRREIGIIYRPRDLSPAARAFLDQVHSEGDLGSELQAGLAPASAAASVV